jgi:hypothetical protein
MWEWEYMSKLAPVDMLALSCGLAIWIRHRGSLAGWLGSIAFLLTAVTWGLRALIFDPEHDPMRIEPYLIRVWLPSLGLTARWCAFAAVVVVAIREITGPRERRGPFSSARWLARILGPLGATVVLAPVLEQLLEEKFTPVTAILVLLNLAALVVGVVYVAKFIYRMWAAIQDGRARTTPGRAVGFLFIPVFNLYWIFVAYWGWTRDFNRHVREKGMQAPRMPQGMTLTFCILALVALVPYVNMPVSLVNLALLGVFVASACEGLNAIAPAGDTDAA